MKNILKKWWLWLIILILIIWAIIAIKDYKDKKEIEEKFSAMGEAASDFYEGIQTAEGYSDYFTYNYSTEEVEYHPPITIERYNNIKEGMTEKEVVSILGDGEKLQPEGSNGFLMTWGDLDLSKYPYYRIQITFDNSGNVTNKMQLGLD